MIFKTIKYLILCVIYFVLITSCKKAETDEEISKLIVGTWKTQTGGGGFTKPKYYHYMEFTEDERYLEVHTEGEIEDFNNDITVALEATAFSGISLEDSVYYEIDNGTIIFSADKSILPFPNFVPNNMEITWLKSNKLKIEDDKYEKH